MKVGSRGIGAIDDDELAWQGLVALLDPDLPVDVRFAEGVMIGFDAIEGRSAREICGLHGRETLRARAVAPPEQVFQRQSYADTCL